MEARVAELEGVVARLEETVAAQRGESPARTGR